MFVGLGQDYYGPPAPGQAYSEYQKQMNTRIVATVGTGLAVAALANPVVGIAAGIGAWLMTPALSKKSKPKPLVQGG